MRIHWLTLVFPRVAEWKIRVISIHSNGPLVYSNGRSQSLAIVPEVSNIC